MAVTWTPASEVKPSQKRVATAENYSTITGLLDLGLIDKPSIGDALVETYGNQDLTGFARMNGTFRGVSAEKSEWFENVRLHNAVTGTNNGTGTQPATAAGSEELVLTVTSDSTIRLYDVLSTGKAILYVTDVTGSEVTVSPYTVWGENIANPAGTVELIIIGNEYAVATDQPAEWIESAVKHRESPFVIMKDKYEIPGSQMTNIAWVRVPAGKENQGGWVWYLKGENDQRARFENYCETLMVQAQVASNSAVTSLGANGTEGLFAAIDDRGIKGDGPITDLADVRSLTQELENERGAAEYTIWSTISQTQQLDDMIATASGSVANTSYGLFDNDRDMALNFGFSGFRDSGYDFYYKKWKLANDPEMLGAHSGTFNAVFIPADTVMDARSSEHIPSFSIGYKEAEGYSREIEVFLLGSANIPFATDGRDVRAINYRTERNMCVAAANRYVKL